MEGRERGRKALKPLPGGLGIGSLQLHLESLRQSVTVATVFRLNLGFSFLAPYCR